MKPILFNGEMVRAILDGRKTVTRRVIKPQPLFFTGRRYVFADDEFPKKWEDCDNFVGTYRYQPGDILYVRETFRLIDFAHIDGDWSAAVQYKADDEVGGRLHYLKNGADERIGWRPSIHMPREAARIFLRVKDVSVERLQTITMDGMLAEGVIPKNVTGGQHQQWQNDYMKPVWDSIIAPKDLNKYGWYANPWVWVIKFEQISREEAMK